MNSSGRGTATGIALIVLGIIAYFWLRGQRADEWFQILVGLFLVYYWYTNRQSATPWTLGLGVALAVDQIEELARGVAYLQGDSIYLWPAAVAVAGLTYLLTPGSGGQRRTTTGTALLIVALVWHYLMVTGTGGPTASMLIIPILVGLYVLYVWNQQRGRGTSDPFAFGWGLMMVIGPIAWNMGMRDLFPGLFLVAAGIEFLIPRQAAPQTV
ncbi:MAG: hypothetical protein ACRDFT_06860 [bacterium]